MRVYESDSIRNVAMIGHGAVGKTSLTSALLFTAGAVNRLARVEDGNTVTDWDEEEIERKVSISAALAHCEWNKRKVNILDTPGYHTFLADTKLALRATDAAVVVVDSVAGVEVQTEKVWEFADEFGLPRLLVINKMDRDNADFERALASVNDTFGRAAMPIQLPIGAEKDFTGVVDLLSGKAYEYPEAGCPNGGGPTPVRINSANASFCIDSTEVTRGQYAAFLASGPKISDLPAVCQWKLGFIPGGSWPPAPDEEKLPASNVDWCDALSFCAWSGKHLCGRIGGGPVADPRDTNTSEWLFACSKGGSRIYPYGNSYDPLICNGGDLKANRLLEVASLPGCVGDGIFDMSGNAHELLDSCTLAPDAGPPSEDRCSLANSAYDGHDEDDMKCAAIIGWDRSQRNNAVGFRCCSN